MDGTVFVFGVVCGMALAAGLFIPADSGWRGIIDKAIKEGTFELDGKRYSVKRIGRWVEDDGEDS